MKLIALFCSEETYCPVYFLAFGKITWKSGKQNFDIFAGLKASHHLHSR